MIEICRFCGAKSKYWKTALIMQKYSVKYYDCNNCGYVQTEKPYWLEEAYSSAINKYDTGILSRNYQNAQLMIFLLMLIWGTKFREKNCVDYAGGYGILVRLLRDYKIKSYWHDKYCENLFSEEYKWKPTVDSSVDLLSAFELFEHFEFPGQELQNLLLISKNILFSTTLIDDLLPDIGDWWYYGVEHGQHIGFYRKRTLQYMAEKNNLNLLSDGRSIHMLTEKNISSIAFKFVCILSKCTLSNFFKRI